MRSYIPAVAAKVLQLQNRLNRLEDRKVLDALLILIKQQAEEIESLKQAQAVANYGDGEIRREQAELIRSYESRLGYY